MKRIFIDNRSLDDIEKVLKEDLKEYAAYRKRNVDKGLESPSFAAILVEKYALGLSKAVQLLFFDQERFSLLVDEICLGIDPDYKLNISKRNSDGFAAVVISKRKIVQNG